MRHFAKCRQVAIIVAIGAALQSAGGNGHARRPQADPAVLSAVPHGPPDRVAFPMPVLQ